MRSALISVLLSHMHTAHGYCELNSVKSPGFSWLYFAWMFVDGKTTFLLGYDAVC